MKKSGKESKKSGLQNHTQHRILKFNDSQWMQFATLLERGYTLQQIMELMGVDYEKIVQRIDQKETLQDIILTSAKGKFYDYLSFFIHLHTLHEAIYSSLHMVAFEKQLKKNLYKKTMYPLFIFLISFFTIYLFSNYVIPQLLSSFDSHDNQLLYHVLNIIKTGSISILLLLVILLSFLILITKNRFCAELFYQKVALHISLCRDYISYYLSGYLKTLHARGLSSRQSFQFLLQLQKNRYLNNTVISINHALSKGADMIEVIANNPYLSKQFKMNFMIAVHNGEFENTLENFMILQQEKWFLLIRNISIAVQCVSYAFVGILVICVYQIMLIPLQMIEEM